MRCAPTYSVEMHCRKRRRIRLCCLTTAKQKAPLQRVEWGWRIYNIAENESDPLTRQPLDLFENEPLKDKWEVHLHTPTKFGEDRPKDLGGDRKHTNTYTNAARIIVWFSTSRVNTWKCSTYTKNSTIRGLLHYTTCKKITFQSLAFITGFHWSSTDSLCLLLRSIPAYC